MKKIGKVRGCDHAFSSPFVANIELCVSVVSSKGDGMPTKGPNNVGRGHNAVLEESSEGFLRGRTRADIEGSVEDAVGIKR